MKTFQRVLSIVLLAMLLMSLVSFADAGSKPTISQHPEDAVVEPGGKAVFHAKAKGNCEAYQPFLEFLITQLLFKP